MVKKGTIGAMSQVSEETVVWGKELEKEDFVKIPRALICMPRFLGKPAWDKLQIEARHVMLILVLASKKFKRKPIRAYWEELGEDLGVDKDTVRKWAYKLRDQGLLEIIQHRGRGNNRVGQKNERNEFKITGFLDKLAIAGRARNKDREDRRNIRQQERGDV